jgi:hypothetical protein
VLWRAGLWCVGSRLWVCCCAYYTCWWQNGTLLQGLLPAYVLQYSQRSSMFVCRSRQPLVCRNRQPATTRPVLYLLLPLAGVAFSKSVQSNADNIGYIIPYCVVEHFLSEYLALGSYNGIVGVGFYTQVSTDVHCVTCSRGIPCKQQTGLKLVAAQLVTSGLRISLLLGLRAGASVRELRGMGDSLMTELDRQTHVLKPIEWSTRPCI